MIGEKGLYKFITNSKGFRNQKEFSYEKAENTYRILYIGDSFVAGMGVDQDEMSGTILENTINSLILENKKTNIIYDNVEVIVSCLEQPATEWYWLQEYGLKYNPDLILLGLCMGNDISQSYLSIDPKGEYFIENYEGKPFIRRDKEHAHGVGFRTHPFVNSILPEKVYDKNSVLYYIYLSNHQKIRIICDRFRKSKLFVKINFERIFPRVIISWYEKAGVSKGRGIHLFDPNHALGFYLKHQPPIISESFNRLFSILSGMKKTCDTNGRNFLVCLFPQRFQTTDDEWVKTMKHYSLNPQYFDINAPQGRILRQCNMVNIACYDLSKFFKNESRSKNRPLYLLGGDMHWNSYGHRIAGESMAKYIFSKYIKKSHKSLFSNGYIQLCQ